MAIRDRIARLRVPRNTRDASSPTRNAEPWWVRGLTDFGRPLVAVIVMVMCAPGEHHLGVLAGWDGRLAWGMAAIFAAYAGIASVVATRRPKGAPGKASAVAGAIVALLLAMAAQPVSHAFVTGWLSATPRTPLLLVIVVSCVPPLVLGHLLHLAAAHGTHTVPARDAAETPAPDRDAVPTPAPALPIVPAGARMLVTATPCGVRPTEPDAQDGQDDRELISSNEVAILLGVDPSTVRNWVSRGQLAVARKDARGRNLFDPLALPRLATAASHG
ncbi:MAG: helix-turn-helix domain-containing protein [Streptomyces sp.]|nr:helix-turn-helix domain-containing protein [Streptomyces sp.]